MCLCKGNFSEDSGGKCVCKGITVGGRCEASTNCSKESESSTNRRENNMLMLSWLLHKHNNKQISIKNANNGNNST